ncbi:hypothetical protein BDC45DRAFT_540999 [Circinella umbellata]|nr:hypothetical protein BDC45DRAFT_540999 [Circinella umbellata]
MSTGSRNQQQQSYIQMMNHHYYQGIPVTPVEAMILTRLDRLEDLILASKNQAAEALEEPVEEDAGDDEPPAEFIRKVRNAKMADVEAAILALTNMDNSAKRLKMAGLEVHVAFAIKCMRKMVGDDKVGQTWSSQSDETTSFIMKLFIESVSKSDPWILIEKWENNWMARFLLLQKWSNAAKKKSGKAAANDAESVTTVGSEQTREIIRQFLVPEQVLALRRILLHSVHSDRSMRTHGTSSTMSIARKRLSSSLSISNNNNRAVIRRRTD